QRQKQHDPAAEDRSVDLEKGRQRLSLELRPQKYVRANPKNAVAIAATVMTKKKTYNTYIDRQPLELWTTHDGSGSCASRRTRLIFGRPPVVIAWPSFP